MAEKSEIEDQRQMEMLVSRMPARNSGMASMLSDGLGGLACDCAVKVVCIWVKRVAIWVSISPVEWKTKRSRTRPMVLRVVVTVEDGEAGEQAEAGSEAGGDVRLAEAGAVDAEHDDGSGDEPEEREQRDRRKSEGEQSEAGGDGSGEAGGLDGAAPDDGVGGEVRLREAAGRRDWRRPAGR